MAEVISDWQRADDAHLRTYKGVMRLTVAAAAGIAILLVLMASALL